MEIIVEGHKINTKDIWKIEDISDTWNAGFIIHLTGKQPLKIGRKIPYETRTGEFQKYWQPYDKLRKAVEEKWEQDKNDLPVFKL